MMTKAKRNPNSPLEVGCGLLVTMVVIGGLLYMLWSDWKRGSEDATLEASEFTAIRPLIDSCLPLVAACPQLKPDDDIKLIDLPSKILIWDVTVAKYPDNLRLHPIQNFHYVFDPSGKGEPRRTKWTGGSRVWSYPDDLKSPVIVALVTDCKTTRKIENFYPGGGTGLASQATVHFITQPDRRPVGKVSLSFAPPSEVSRTYYRDSYNAIKNPETGELEQGVREGLTKWLQTHLLGASNLDDWQVWCN